MRPSSDSPPAVRFCPFCGQPLGSFFGARIEGGGACCDRCQECFRVQHVEDIGDDISTPAHTDVGDQRQENHE